MANLVGQYIGRYHIIEQLGQGGMAVVYKAYDMRLERDVAIKVIRTDMVQPALHEKMLKRFEREARSLAKMEHPNIVSVYDYGDHTPAGGSAPSAPYLVMQYLPGGTLKKQIGRPCPYGDAARLLLPIADALSYAHKRNVLHRDVKPANILITNEGVPMLSDFGIAKILENSQTVQLTGTGMGLGTPHYMAPEQWRGEALAQTDVYALGVVFYELVTGRRPYDADTPAAIFEMMLVEPLLRPKDFAPGLPDAVEKVLFKALAKQIEDRYPTMGEFARALEQLISKATTAQVSVAPVMADETLTSPVRGAVHLPPEETTQPPPVVQAPITSPPREIPAPTPGKVEMPARDKSAVPAPLPQRAPAAPRPAGGTPKWKRSYTCLGVLAVVSAVALVVLSVYWLFFTVPGRMLYRIPGGPTPPAAYGSQVSTIDGMEMVFVPEGEFKMGSINGDADETPAHNVYLDAFWIDRTEVTNGMFAQCVAAGVCREPGMSRSAYRTRYYGNSKYDDYPVIQIDWFNANDYCEWAGRRLPTEAEWEKAARGTDGRTYPWGEELSCKLVNYSGKNDCVGDTSQVGSYPDGASPYGTLDMAGNVMEWAADWYDENYYSQSPGSNPIGPSSGEKRVLRGGSWATSDFRRMWSTARWWSDPSFSASISNGFRCAASAASP